MRKNNFKIRIALFFLAFSFLSGFAYSQKKAIQFVSKPPVFLYNNKISLKINTAGGAMVGFEFKDQKVNPLSWVLPSNWSPKNNQKGAIFQGHFLCLGRWGAPSDGEIAKGVPHNGEQTVYNWDINSQTSNTLVMSYKAQLDLLSVKRTVSMPENNSIVYVTEDVKNYGTQGRLNNIVQHVTLGAPFLSTKTLINSNFGKGFNQTDTINQLEKRYFEFPISYRNEDTIDYRSCAEPSNYCASFIAKNGDKYGWVTAFNPEINLIIGYVWKVEEYPWLNIWHHIENGVPRSEGIEFGTCGLGKPYKTLVENNTSFFGHQSFEYIDAGETKTKNYIMFLQKSAKNIKNINVNIDPELEPKFEKGSIKALKLAFDY